MKNIKIKISKEINLPLEVVTQTIAILAKRRAGKSYTMRRLVEQLFEAGQQVILVDPKGDQWGIRSSSDGKKPGIPIVILGGEHGDAPLEVNAGEVVAKLVVEEQVSVLLDLSPFRKHEIATFMTLFLENIYRLKAQETYRTPCMLVIDEADAIAPQKPQKGEERMLGAAEDIVRRGGQRGIGCTLVTQRSAVLNKNVLTQAQMLVVLRTIAPQDLAAMKAWIDVHGTPEQGKELMDSLPSLPIGDAWFWYPGWPTDEGIFKRTHVLPIETFDSGATPKPGEKKIVPKNLADIDLDILKKQMAATIEKAKNDNPKVLRKRINELEQDKKDHKCPKIAPVKETKRIEVPVLKDAQLRRLEKVWREVDIKSNKYNTDVGGLWKAMNNMSKVVLDVLRTVNAPKISTIRMDDPKTPETVREYLGTPSMERFFLKSGTSISYPNNEEPQQVRGGAIRMLKVLVSRYPMKLTKSQLATFSKLKPTTGTFGTYFSTLKSNNYILIEGDLIQASQQGIDFLGTVPNPPQSPEELIDMWKSNLRGGARRMFEVLVENYPEPLNKEDLGAAVGMVSNSGSFGTYISILRSNGLIEVRGQEIKAADNLYI